MNLIAVFLICFTSAVFSQESTIEDSIFDENYTKETSNFLLEEYKRKQVLFLGTATHINFRHFNHLKSLLKLIGDDPNLKYVVFERPHDITGFYEILSTETLETSLKMFEFQSEFAKINSMCMSPEWAYTIGDFIPWLRNLNHNLRPNHPILFKSVDSTDSSMKFPPVNDPKVPVEDGTCKASSIGITTGFARQSGLIVTGAEREKGTARIFESEIWKKLKPNEKAIVIYKDGHLIDFENCRPELGEDGMWRTNFGPLNWLRYFLNANPSARSSYSFVVMDEKDASYNINGIFKLTQRQFKRHQYNFAISLKPFKGFLSEVGINVLDEKSRLRQWFSSPSSSPRTLDQLVDGIIWSSESYEDYMIKESHTYLPDYCASQETK